MDTTRTFRGRLTIAAASLSLALAGAVVAAHPAAASSEGAEQGPCTYVSDNDRPTIDPGDHNVYVAQIQCLINHYSAYPNLLVVDWDYGPATRAAVGWVQNCNRTSGGIDYQVGPSTWRALYHPRAGCAA